MTLFAGKSFLSFIKLADRDGSGKVSREEFLDALHRCARTPHVFMSLFVFGFMSLFVLSGPQVQCAHVRRRAAASY